MNSSKDSSQQCLLPKWLIWGLIIVSFLGFLDATYLTIAHYSGISLKCTILHGCDIVTTSPYSLIFGIPVALFGGLYYFTILICSILYFDTKHKTILKFMVPLTIAGFLASVWFVYLQFFVINALCQYCMLSAITSTVLFIFGLIINKKLRTHSA